eukprot:13969728-Alexandrium_andersonii.AAC.1
MRRPYGPGKIVETSCEKHLSRVREWHGSAHCECVERCAACRSWSSDVRVPSDIQSQPVSSG